MEGVRFKDAGDKLEITDIGVLDDEEPVVIQETTAQPVKVDQDCDQRKERIRIRQAHLIRF